MQIVLYQPEIPPNTGNIARLCAATQTPLHLIEPLGFRLEDKYLRRAGLDYWKHVQVRVWPNWEEFLEGISPGRLVFSSARKGVELHQFPFQEQDLLVFGPETRGLPPELLANDAPCIRVPIWGEVRSLNLSTCAGIVLYEALRQTGGIP
ncbi:tRNA (cytidine/uridine-2'-O-)-methyltransferase [Desulfonatronum thiosulfatophilum]|uniref:Putative tRNA (cytidine(34)-2'-O)-methyltransferase n=1 Tax=Desulfonatronum thiosulfatophilum TaxID=617002 RepID=A0A1G6B1U8_9BACT|nr:tRNA (cytidine(34)-2'-O)-methyltransferase [Desulfonatronum thiosulfatophilum]SDB14640.1 tRNA (cytidine/uridine-2'-O-)-methyltransferase [Desulfonatronum thiosulfatophilum]